MTLTGKISAFVLAGGMTVAMASPSLAAWVVVKIGGSDDCSVLEESVAGEELRVAGPFETEAEAEESKENHAECIQRN